MLTQVYEISTPEEARSVAAIGVDHIGIKVGTGEFPRELSVTAAAEIIAAVPPPAKCAVLFLTADIQLITKWASDLRPAIVHLGAHPDALTPDDVVAFKKELPGSFVMRSVPVFGAGSLSIAQSYGAIADALMLDSIRSVGNKIGALGITHDWSISRRIVELLDIPVFLAGGLGPNNVAEAIRFVRPAGVDSKTKTDRDGSHRKDLDRVRRFHEAARAAL